MNLFSSSSSSSQTSTAADLSKQGQEDANLYYLLIAQELKNLNYDLKVEQKTTYKDQKKYDVAQAKLDKLQSDSTSLDAQLADPKLKQTNPTLYQKLTAQKSNTEQQIVRQTQAIAGLDKETYNDFTLTKLEDVRVRDAVEKYGDNSKQATEMRAKIKSEEVFNADSQAEVTKNYLTSLKKYTAGDFSYTKEQESQINKLISPIKKAVNATADELLNKYGDDYKSMTAEMNKVGAEISKTNFSVMSALEAASVQIDKSGQNLMTILKGVNESSENKAMFQFDLLSQQIDQQVDSTNAMLGLPPGSQSSEVQKAKLKNDAMKSVQLELARETALGTMNIASNVESGKQQISLQKVALAESTGSKREGLAKYGVDLLGSYLGKEESVVSAKNQELINLEKSKSEQLYNAATGNLQNIISAGQSGLAFDKSMTSQDMAQTAGVASQTYQPLSFENNLRMYEGTTKSNTKSTPSAFDVGTDIASVAAGGYTFGNDQGWWGK